MNKCEHCKIEEDWLGFLYQKNPHLERHHIRPRKRGGCGKKMNLIYLCHGCHQKVHTMSNGKVNWNYVDPVLTLKFLEIKGIY